MPFAHLDAVLAEAEPIARRFAAAGHATYLVGGVVRDLWLDASLHDESDLDLTTDARPEQIKQLLEGHVEALWTQGERFGTIGCIVAGRSWEITTHRSGVYDPTSRKPQVHYADRIDADLSRRDFTVNAMAIALPDGQLFDPFGGADDLGAGRLRTPLSPAQSFGDDPLRMLRAARFAATHRLRPDPDVETAIATMAGRLDIVSVERLRIELDKLVIAPDPSPGLDLARRTGLLSHVLPEFAALSSPDWDRCMARLVRVAPDLLPRLATLVLAIDDALRAPRLDALRHPRRVTHAAVELARGVERFVASPPRTDAELRRAVVAAGGRWAEVLELARSIEPGLGVDLVVRRSAELDADLGALGTDAELPIDGRDVIKILGVDTGPLVGDALDVVRAARLDHGPLDATTARRLLTEWWSSRPVR